MKQSEEDDGLLTALAGLPEHDIEPGRANDVLGEATAALRRGARFAAARTLYARYLEPVAAAILSCALLGFTAANGAYVLQHGIGLWR